MWEGHLLLQGAALVSLASLCLKDITLKSLNTGQTAKGTAKQHHTIDLLVARKKGERQSKVLQAVKGPRGLVLVRGGLSCLLCCAVLEEYL